MQRKLIIFLNLTVSLALVAAILWLVGVGDVISELERIGLAYMALAISCVFLMDLVMSYRISILLEEAGVRLGFIDILKSHFVGMLLADFTPSRTGYFATAAALRYNYGVPSEKALLSIFGPQIFDFAFKLVAGSAAILYIMFLFIGPERGLVLIGGAAVLLAIVAVMLLLLFSRRFLALFSFVRRFPVLPRFYDVVAGMQDNSHVVVNKAPHILFLMLFTWTFRALSWYFVAKSVGITVSTPFPEVLFYFFLQPLVTMLEFVPSPTIAGLGLSEGGATLVFSLFGVVPAKAALFALLARFKNTALHLPAVPEALKMAGAGKLDMKPTA